MLRKDIPLEDCAKTLDVPLEVIRKHVESVEDEFQGKVKEFGEERAKTNVLERIHEAARAGNADARSWLRRRNLLKDGE